MKANRQKMQEVGMFHGCNAAESWKRLKGEAGGNQFSRVIDLVQD